MRRYAFVPVRPVDCLVVAHAGTISHVPASLQRFRGHCRGGGRHSRWGAAAGVRWRAAIVADVEWERPVPVIGDVTAASQRSADPSGWAFPAAERGALYDVIRARRDVRRFRPDDVPAPVLTRILSAAHAAPSVGHSQPWRFIVVRDAARRERAALLADRERLRQAAQMEPDAARRLLDLQLEGIREAPLGVVVCCDRRTAAAGVLGRATFPDADMWSCAAAIQNLWLAARAEGLGLGWVTLFQPDDLADLVGLPDGVVTLGWLCVGWPDERPPAPGLERAGWSSRMPIDDVVFLDAWRETTAPPRSHAGAGTLRAPDQAAVVGAHDAADRLLTPPGSLGILDRAVDRIVALGRGDDDRGTLVLAAADHPVAMLGVSAYRPDVTREVLAAAAAGTAIGVRAAAATGLGVRLVDAGVWGEPVDGLGRAPLSSARGNLVDGDAMGRDDTERPHRVRPDAGGGRRRGRPGRARRDRDRQHHRRRLPRGRLARYRRVRCGGTRLGCRQRDPRPQTRGRDRGRTPVAARAARTTRLGSWPRSVDRSSRS